MRLLWRAVCLIRGHRPKFDTNPVRGICIRCGKWPKGVDRERWEHWQW